MAKLLWCVLVMVLIACQVHNAASDLTVTSTTTAASIAENVAVGTTVVSVSPSGTDITYLVSQNPDTDPKLFAINGTSGVVSVTDITHLDFEKENEYTLVIKATQTAADSSNSGTVNVTITVTDVNEAPKFAEDRYTACVNKSSPEGTDIIHVTATDEDKDDMVSYSITDNSIFEVETTTGKIKVKSGQTIGETPASHNLILEAADDDATTHLTGTTTVSINVADPCPVVTTPPVVTTTPVVTTPPGETPPPNFGTLITASFCLFLISGAVHLLRIW